MKRSVMKFLNTMFVAALMFVCFSITSLAYTETEGKITVDTAKVREAADTSSDVAKLLDKGTTVTIIDETTDSAGTVWYKISVSGIEGYVRSDLMEKGQPIATATTDTSATDTSASTVEGVTAMDLQYAQIAVETGKVRSNASTKDSIVTTLSKGQQVTVDGQKTGSDGKTWYHISVVAGDGSAYSGFVRSDLVTLGEMVPVQAPAEETNEEVVVEESVVEPTVPQDYETVYTDDGTGNNVWYLYDHNNNSRMKLEDLLNYVDSEAQRITEVDALAGKLKILVVILAVLLVAAVVAIILLVLKLRDAMYEDYGYDDEYYEEDEPEEEEEEDEEDEEEYRPSPRRRSSKEVSEARDEMASRTADEGVRRERKPVVDEADKPVRQTKQTAKSSRSAKEVGYEEDDLTVEGAVQKPASAKKKNFVIDDEDFSFEFLNMD